MDSDGENVCINESDAESESDDEPMLASLLFDNTIDSDSEDPVSSAEKKHRSEARKAYVWSSEIRKPSQSKFLGTPGPTRYAAWTILWIRTITLG